MEKEKYPYYDKRKFPQIYELDGLEIIHKRI
jgi:hypothetical protein